MTRAWLLFAAGMFAFSHDIRAGEPGWLRRDPAKAAASADVIVMARIRDVSVLSGKTGRPLRKLPGYVDERNQGQRLRLTLEHPQVLWPDGGSVQDAVTISWDGVTTSCVTACKNSTVILLLVKSPQTKPPIYTTPGHWPLADAKDLPVIQGAISARSASSKSRPAIPPPHPFSQPMKTPLAKPRAAPRWCVGGSPATLFPGTLP